MNTYDEKVYAVFRQIMAMDKSNDRGDEAWDKLCTLAGRLIVRDGPLSERDQDLCRKVAERAAKLCSMCGGAGRLPDLATRNATPENWQPCPNCSMGGPR